MPEGLDLHMFDLNIGTMEDLSDDEGKGVEEEEMKIINEKKYIGPVNEFSTVDYLQIN